MKYIIYLLIIFYFSCNNVLKKDGGKIHQSLFLKNNNDSLNTIFRRLDKLVALGDFNGDGKIDTLLQNNINSETKVPIDSIPDIPFDSLQRYFDRLGSEVILNTSYSPNDTLKLGSGEGLFCLINIGDINNDKKDEIALVVDNCSFSNVVQCQIYTQCKNKWVELKCFNIHRSTFDYTNNKIVEFKEILGFLEYRNDKWMYIDYLDWYNAETEKDKMLIPLRIKKGC